jgi:short-chain fatty acids transporter
MKEVWKVINRMLMFLVNLMQKYLPDPFTIAWILTLIVFAMAIFINNKTPLEVVNYWGRGFFDILAFAMQMSLVLITGYSLASARIVHNFLKALVRIPKTPRQTVVFISFMSCVLYLLNWGFGLIGAALLAREAAKRRDVDFRLLVAAAFSGIMVVHGGLSASVPLLINTKGHFLEQEIGIIPLTQTIFHPQNLLIVISLVIILPLLCMVLIPKKEDTVLADPDNLVDETAATAAPETRIELADHLDRSKILNYSLGLIGLGFLGYTWYTSGFNLNINTLILLFLMLGICAHGSLVGYSQAFTKGSAMAGGIILQYGFYAGIMGVMKGSGLVFTLSDWLLKLATYNTYEICCYVSSVIITLFIPSAGGHWVVQAPFMLPAAAQLGVEPWKVAMGVAWGENIANILCAFWAIPLLAIANVSLRDLMGFCMMLFIVGFFVTIGGMLLIPG